MLLRIRNRSFLCGFDWEENPEKGNFKITELLTKTLLFPYFSDRPKNGEENKEDVESICARVNNMHQDTWRKLKVNLNWI